MHEGLGVHISRTPGFANLGGGGGLTGYRPSLSLVNVFKASHFSLSFAFLRCSCEFNIVNANRSWKGEAWEYIRSNQHCGIRQQFVIAGVTGLEPFPVTSSV